ncbi:MAG: phosphodiester glycosidase family protein [Kastovskya adunca ATA6-11-RM4]|jgi:exopolysaccharide biosynthesis protein|nr:phosphodiester glycosidase family protein [Kastovskya adunca ATA6-11-RM4]
MRKIFWWSWVAIAFGMALLISLPRNQPPSVPSSVVQLPPKKEIRYDSYTLASSVVHTLLIPSGSRFSVIPVLSPQLSTVENFAQKHNAIAVLNGGFFDPQNRKTTSYILQQGSLVADPRLNERLINNSQLVPYLNKILNRSEFRRYRCGATFDYDIALHSEPTPMGCQLVDALGGGPSLLPELSLVEEGFQDFADGKVIRDSLDSDRPNARSAVGITADGSLLLVMVAQKPETPSTSGMSLKALADFMKTQGVEKAMNLDGGSSSSLYYQGKTFSGKVDEQGDPIQRSVFSVLLVEEN